MAACATLDAEECQTINWQQLGDTDGANGFPQERVAKHAKACEKHSLPINEKAYFAGWQGGIARYCTPQNGFRQGWIGRHYRNSCPSELAGGFVEAYSVAITFNRAEAEVRHLENKISSAAREISRLADSKDPKDIERLKDETEKLKHAQNRLPSAREEKARAQRAMNDYLRAHPEIRSI